MKYKLTLSLLFCVYSLLVAAQSAVKDTAANKPDKLIQFSGVIITHDSLQPIPYVTVFDKTTRRGTISDFYGFFSFVAREKDTIVFSSIGFKKAYYIIPDSLTENRYSIIQMLKQDTIVLKEQIIYPWPSKEQFAQAFVNLSLPEDYLAKAQKNLEKYSLYKSSLTLPNDPEMSYRYAMQKELTKMYSAGQVPTLNLLNPVAWYKFIEAWKNGDFKNKD